MQIRSVATDAQAEFITELKQRHAEAKDKPVVPFSDPLREFASASLLSGTARGWLTLPIAERKRRIARMGFSPKNLGDPEKGVEPETDRAYEARHLEEWRALCVVIQEESRAKAGNRCPEVAIAALKFLFPEHPFVTGNPK